MATSTPENYERSTPGIGFSDLLSLTATIRGPGQYDITPVFSLNELELNTLLLQNATRIIKKLTPIQRYTVPALLNRKNVLCCSFTGSGKTAAFLIPILHLLLQETRFFTSMNPASPKFLVLVPTRELAIQIKREADTYVKGTPIEDGIHLVCGGKDMTLEQHRLQTRPCDVVVATNGRLLDLIDQQFITLKEVKYFILDEADIMMDKGFYGEVINISKMCSEEHHAVMLSATYPNSVRKAAENLLGEFFVEILVGQDGPTASWSVTQNFDLVEESEKDFFLKNYLLTRSDKDKILIFVSTIPEVERITKVISDSGYSVAFIHSKLPRQFDREFALKKFKRNEVRILVATSIAARGLDIPNVSLVVNYDMPNSIEEYVLRIGRTGRVGNDGESFSFFEIIRDGPLASALISSLGRSNQVVPEWLYTVETQFVEEETRLHKNYDIGPLSNSKRIFNAHGSSFVGVPLPCEADDDTWD